MSMDISAKIVKLIKSSIRGSRSKEREVGVKAMEKGSKGSRLQEREVGV